MATHYSILSVQIRPEIQERISIGFVLSDSIKTFFNYSKNKLSVAKDLLSENAYRTLKDSLKNIETTALFENEKVKISVNELPLSKSLLKNSFSVDYLNYLSRYNTNVLTFSQPKIIDLESRDEIFQKLFRKYVDDSEFSISSVVTISSIEYFKEIYKPQFKKHFNIEKQYTTRDIPNLLAPVTIFLSGKSEQEVFAQSIDMDRGVYHIENDIAQLLLLRTAFEQSNKKSKGFVVTQEPDKREKKQHDIWVQLYKGNVFDYVDVSEGGKILEYAEEYGVQPLVAEETNEKP